MKLLCVGSHLFEPTHHSMGAIALGVLEHFDGEVLAKHPRPHPRPEIPPPGKLDFKALSYPWRPGADLVHAVSGGETAIKVARLLAEEIPYVVSFVGGADLTRQLVDPELAAGYRDLFRRADAITVPFPQATRILLQAGAPAERLVEIPLALVATDYPRHHPPGTPTAIWVGRRRRRKNRPLAVAAAAASKRLERLLVVGERDGTEAACSDPRVEFLGAVSHADLLPLLASSHLLLQTGWTSGDEIDTLPTVVLEALAIGMPVVSTPLEGVRDLARRHPEMIRTGSTAAELGRQMDRLLAAMPDAGAARAAGEAIARDFALDAAIRGFLKLYQKLLPAVSSAGGHSTDSPGGD